MQPLHDRVVIIHYAKSGRGCGPSGEIRPILSPRDSVNQIPIGAGNDRVRTTCGRRNVERVNLSRREGAHGGDGSR